MAAGNKFLLEILTPQKKYYSGEVEMVVVEEMAGKEGYMAGHSPVLKLLNGGEVKIKECDQKIRTAIISGGYIYYRDSLVIYSPQVSWKEE